MSDSVIRFGEITRGSGKVFVRVYADAASLLAQSSDGKGLFLPAESFALGAGEWVVTVPVLTCAQHLNVCVYDEEGAELASAKLRVSPLAARLHSSLNTLRKNEAALAVRNIDTELAPFALTVHRLIPAGEETLVVCGAEAFPLSFEIKDMEVRAFAVDGTLLTDAFVDLGTSVRPDAVYPSRQRMRSTFSLRVPSVQDGIIIDVRFGSVGHFIELEAWKVAELAGRWAIESTPADRDVRYEDWFLNHHRMRSNDRVFQSLASKSFPVQPVYSLIVPLFRTPLDFLREMVESVQAQTYPHWELLLVNASPDDEALGDAAKAYVAADERIRLIPLEDNYGITENTNAGIKAATGDFLAFLDHDDVIEPDLLYWYTKGINDYPETDLLYCDEDHLQDGHYIVPFFKPDWDPDLLCSENYVTHMLTVRKSIVDALPELPDRRFDGSQDHNMTFLVGEQARNVYHARRVLYHWRIHENSTAGKGVGQKSYALEAERLAVQGHLDRCGIPATAEMETRIPGRCEIKYHFEDYPLVSIVIPNKDARTVLATCIDSILERTTWPNYEIVVVENNSTDPETFEYYEQLRVRDQRIRVVTSETGGVFNFSKVINDGFAAAHANYLLMLNNDTEVLDPHWLEQLMGPCMRNEIGAVGCKLLYADDTYQHVGVAVGRGTGPFHIDMGLPDGTWGYYEQDVLTHRASAVTGACMLTKRNVFEAVGGLDENLSVNFNDIDYCLRVQKEGYAVLVQLATSLRHYESVTRAPSTDKANAIAFGREHGIFFERWQSYVTLGEHFYSKNFRFMNAFRMLEA